MKYSEWSKIWMHTNVRPSVKDSTYYRYGTLLSGQIVPAIGQMELGEITVEVVQLFIARLAERYSTSTVKTALSIIKRSFKEARTRGFVTNDFEGELPFPRATEKLVESFSYIEQRRLEKYIFGSRNQKYFGIMLCLYTGLRIGELMALRWSDFDFVAGTLTVCKTCRDCWSGGEYKKIIELPKTSSSLRVIPLPKQLLPRLRAAESVSKSEYLVCGRDGRLVSVRSYQMTFTLLLKKLGLPHRGFHALRHTFATRALECGMDIKTLSELLGHSNPNITLRRYVHSMLEHKRAMMNKLGRTMY